MEEISRDVIRQILLLLESVSCSIKIPRNRSVSCLTQVWNFSNEMSAFKTFWKEILRVHRTCGFFISLHFTPMRWLSNETPFVTLAYFSCSPSRVSDNNTIYVNVQWVFGKRSIICFENCTGKMSFGRTTTAQWTPNSKSSDEEKQANKEIDPNEQPLIIWPINSDNYSQKVLNQPSSRQHFTYVIDSWQANAQQYGISAIANSLHVLHDSRRADKTK